VTRRLALTVGAFLFGLVATANSGGYRYGVSDQAFYATAVVKDLHPSFFPRDTPLLETQARLMWSDEIVAGFARAFGVDLPPLFFALYVLTLLALFFSAVVFGRAAGLSWWAVATLLILLTFRHRIAKTGANSLEGYMHPRELAFALGVAALSCLLRGRYLWAAVWTLLSACWHPTTAFWFAVVIAVGVVAARESRTRLESRRTIALAAIVVASVALWLVLRGPLAGRLVTMDAAWLAVLAEKDYLFPHEWPLYAWIANLAYPIIIVLVFRRRRVQGVTVPGEAPLVTGMLALVGIFVISLPLTALRLALPVQMQVTRVFWLLDFTMAVYLAWWLAEDVAGRRQVMRAVIIGVLAAFSLGRGYYLSFTQPNRQLIAVSLPRSPWVEAMQWLKAQPPTRYVLADPGHAWKYGVSVRLAAEKDTLIESGKDTALALYDRNIAMAVADRLAALRDFDQLTTPAALALRARYGLDVVVLEHTQRLELPELYRNREFVIYDLR
jgi:hypothetical protein